MLNVPPFRTDRNTDVVRRWFVLKHTEAFTQRIISTHKSFHIFELLGEHPDTRRAMQTPKNPGLGLENSGMNWYEENKITHALAQIVNY